MSYILDALKKSELERTRKAAPSLIGTEPTPTNVRARVLLAVAVALFANAVILGAWWLWPKESPTAPVASPEESLATETQKPAVDAPPETPAPIAAVVPEPVRPQVAAARPPGAPTPTPAKTIAKPVPFNALSSDERRAFEGLAFSTHLFADDPSFRAVTVNGRQYKEGDTLTNGLVLSEITEEGVVVESRGKRVELPLLQDWRL